MRRVVRQPAQLHTGIAGVPLAEQQADYYDQTDPHTELAPKLMPLRNRARFNLLLPKRQPTSRHQRLCNPRPSPAKRMITGCGNRY
jgi:hypothetical protein